MRRLEAGQWLMIAAVAVIVVGGFAWGVCALYWR